MPKLANIALTFMLLAVMAALSVGATGAQNLTYKLTTYDQKAVCGREWGVVDLSVYHTITYHSYDTTLGITEWICHGAEVPHGVVRPNVEDYCEYLGYSTVIINTKKASWWNPFKKVTTWTCIG